MNICFLYGKIISEIEFKFIYNSKKHSSIANLQLETSCKNEIQKLTLFAFDALADKIFSQYNKNNFIKIIGKIENQKIIILEVES